MALDHRFLVSALLTAALTVATQARAQGGEEFSLDESTEGEAKQAPPAKSVKPATGPEGEQLLGDEQALEEERAPQERFRETTDPYEDPKKRYMFFGGGWRFSRIPTWMMGAYGIEAGPAVGTPISFTGELAFRKNGFQVTSAVGFTKLDINGPYQLKGDPVQDTEWLEADFKFLNLTVALTWSTSFTDWFALEYGLEAGIGFVFGDMTRSEAYRDSNGNWGKCHAWASQASNGSILFNPEFPRPTREQREFCDPPAGDPDEPPPTTNTNDEDGAQYGVKAKRGLLNGGVPYVIPILGPRLSLRFKPIHQVVLRIDVPLPQVPFGFQGGVAAQYGF